MVGSVPRKCFRFSGCSATKSAADWLACTPITLAALGGAPACQARAHFLQRFPRPSWLRTALWVGKLTDSRFCDSAFVWNDPLNWHSCDGQTLRERKHQWREGSDIPGSFSAPP